MSYLSARSNAELDYDNHPDDHEEVGQVPVTCEVCGKEFYVLLWVFREKFDSFEPALFTCDDCSPDEPVISYRYRCSICHREECSH